MTISRDDPRALPGDRSGTTALRRSTLLPLIVVASIFPAMVSTVAPAAAQVTPPASFTNNPALLRETDIDKINDRFARPDSPLTSTEPEVPVLLDQTKPPGNADAIQFPFKGFELEQPSPIAQAAVDEIGKDLSGRTVSLLDVFEAAAAVGRRYEAQGYFRPKVSVPPQKITGGTVKLRVEEFSVDRAIVTIDGAPAPSDPVLDRVIADVKADRPLSHAVFQSARDRLKRELGLSVTDLDSDVEPDHSVTVTVGLSRRASTAEERGGIEVPPSLSHDKPPMDAALIRFRLDRLEVAGVTTFGADVLTPLYAGSIGQEISLADLYAIAAKIRGRYEADGIVPPNVEIPAQSIIDGVARIEVTEIWASKVVVLLDGKELPPGDLLYRTANRVANVQPLTIAALNRHALLLTDIPGISIRSITPPKGPGEIATVELARKTFAGSVGMDNRGSQPTGIIEMMASGSAAGVLGMNERLTVSHITMIDPEEVRILGIGYDQPLSSDGLKLSTYFSRTLGKPGANLKDQQGRSFGSLFTASLFYRFCQLSGQVAQRTGV
ncbi:POTRA domain-containing protein [Skermanella stibiiresistens]|nr:POTRA domain-containing protein [Skermanella stibiiresistens]